MKKIALVSLITFIAISKSLFGQEHHQDSKTHQNEGHDEFKRHSLVLEFGYTHVPDGFEEEPGDQAIWVPTVGLAYAYHFNHKWGVGLTANMETGNYLIEVNREDLIRENVFIFTVVASYEILPNWGVFAGPGIELEGHHHFAVLRFGTEYIVPLKNNWIILPILTFDHKTDYTSWEIAIAIGKRF